MKVKLLIALATLVFFAEAMPVAQAKELLVAISPFQQNANAHIRELVMRLPSLKSGTTVILVDGYHLKKITQFNIPVGQLSPKAIIKRNRKAIAALVRFAKLSSSVLATASDTENSVRLPQLLQFIGENYKFDLSSKLDVIILASPLYDDPAEATVSMAGTNIPSDGHIHASQATSPYGTKEKANLLTNLRVHMGFNDDSDLVNDKHRFYLRRFWTLYIETQGGKLVSFMTDTDILFERVVHNAVPLQHDYILEPSTKLDMTRFRRDQGIKPLYERQLSGKALNKHDVQRAENIEIGIQWDCANCDLDLYAYGKPGAEILYFGRNETALGSHWKDFRSSPSLYNAFETISFKEPLDLRHVRIGVNFYSGSAPEAIHARLRLSASGQTYERTFTLKASSGNRAEGMAASFKESKASNAHIVMFDAISVMQSTQ